MTEDGTSRESGPAPEAEIATIYGSLRREYEAWDAAKRQVGGLHGEAVAAMEEVCRAHPDIDEFNVFSAFRAASNYLVALHLQFRDNVRGRRAAEEAKMIPSDKKEEDGEWRTTYDL